MAKQKILSDILQELIAGSNISIDYKIALDNGNGTYTLRGICDIHHIQPGFSIIIDSNDYVVKDYEPFPGGWSIILEAGTNPVPSAPGTIELYKPLFIHGTPTQTEVELTKIPLDEKTPMIYLMEPYVTELDYSVMSAIDRRCRFTLCFLTQANIPKWLTDDFYHNAINPMYNLAQDMMDVFINSNLFNNVAQRAAPTFYTKFGINIKATGTQKLYFSENLSGVGLELTLDIYKVNECCTNGSTGLINDIELREDNSPEMREQAGVELR